MSENDLDDFFDQKKEICVVRSMSRHIDAPNKL